jgi:hypothetical protein
MLDRQITFRHQSRRSPALKEISAIARYSDKVFTGTALDGAP